MNQGFTLIELLVVVLIIGILAAIALPQYQTAVERSRATEALTQMNAVRTSLERFHAQHESWPTTFNQLDVDIPQFENTYGGKNFSLTFAGNGDSATVTATRRRNTHGYTLTTTITVNADGTYTSVRTCTPSGTTEAADYCYAIAGGAENAANGF